MTFKDDKELQSMDAKHLNDELSKAVQHLNGISFDHQQGNLKDTTKLAKTRRYIAAIKTYHRQRQLEAKKAPAETSK